MVGIADGLVQSGVRQLIVAGDETSGAVLDRLGLGGFPAAAEIAAGVRVLHLAGAKNSELLLALKSGNFGWTAFFSDAHQADALTALRRSCLSDFCRVP